MADPKTKTTPSPEPPKLAPVIPPDAAAPPALPDDVEAIRAQLIAAERERDAAVAASRDKLTTEEARLLFAPALGALAERAEAAEAQLAEKAAAAVLAAEAKIVEPIIERRVVGMIPIYNDDQRHDVLARAGEVLAGKIPADKATRFRTDANVRAPKGSKLTERYRFGELVPIGTEFHRDEIDDATRAHWSASGSIVAIG